MKMNSWNSGRLSTISRKWSGTMWWTRKTKWVL